MPFYKLKTGPSLFFFLFSFFIFKNLILLAERRGFLKNKPKKQPKKHFYKLKIGPIMLRNILGPVFNLYLDQFLTYTFFLFVFVLLAETSIFIVFSAKHAKLKETPKNNTICEHNCANCSCQNVRFFFCIFHFCCFFNFHISEMFLIGFPKSKKNLSKQNKKQEQKVDKRCKAKTNEILWFKTKQDNKQNNRNQRTTLNKKANKTKWKSKNQKQKWKTERKETRK